METVLKNILSILLVVLLVPGSEFLLRIVNTDFRTYPKHSIKLRLRLLQVYTGSFLGNNGKFFFIIVKGMAEQSLIYSKSRLLLPNHPSDPSFQVQLFLTSTPQYFLPFSFPTPLHVFMFSSSGCCS